MTAIEQAVIVQGEDSPELRALVRALHDRRVASGHLVMEDGQEFVLPPSVTRALEQVVMFLARGGQVSLRPIAGEYTVPEAVYFLGASRSYVAGALDRGELPYHLRDAQIRIDHADLVAHRAKLQDLMREGGRLIQQISEEEGAYDER